MDEIKYYSFDIFDTLITRLLDKPTDLFSIIEKKYDIPNFKENRINAEHNAIKNSNHEEITIDEIYDELKTIDSSINTEEVKKIEKELEIKMCVLNKNFINTYYDLKEKNKKIIIISDMYLDIETIKKILSKNNIYYDKLYLSSEIKKSKRSGSLYNYVLNDLKITPNQMIHYGDNRHSDFIIPKKKGIKAVLVNNSWDNNLNYYNSEEEDYRYLAMEKFINSNIKNKFSNPDLNYFYKVGYEILGPLLYGYCEWLNENLKKDNIKKVFFLARDGKIIKKAFDIIFPNFNTCYMFASRRALTVPTIWLFDKLKDPSYLKNIYYLDGGLKMQGLLMMVGLDDIDITPILKKYNFNLTDSTTSEFICNDSQFKSFYNEIYPLLIENSKNEHEKMLEYLEKINFSGKIGIVDIGWNGNLQYALENAIKSSKIDARIKGFYIGIFSNSKKPEVQDMRGYLFQKGHNENIEETILQYFQIFEFFFTTTEGSFKRYADKGFEFYEYEYENSKTREYLEKIQEGAIDFVKDFFKSELSNNINIIPPIAILNFNKLGIMPSDEDLNYFKKMTIYINNEHVSIITTSRGNYIFHPRSFVKDYTDSYWKPGFLNLTLWSNYDYRKWLNKCGKLLNFIKKLRI